MMPGTPVVVCKNDKVIVDVLNAMQADTTSLHFHGNFWCSIKVYGSIFNIYQIKPLDLSN